MKFSRYLLILVLLSTFQAKAQYLIKGSVLDTAGSPLIGAIVKLKFGADSVAASADMNGNFVVRNGKASSFTLKVAYLGFQSFLKNYQFPSGQKEISLNPVQLKPVSNSLNEVVISAVIPVKVKEDTLEFNAKAFAVREGDAVEEVIKKLPGISVDKEGNVTTQGKAINKIRVNGKDFFGTDVATAIQNLPADIVKSLQVIDDYGDQARLTGIKTGEPEKVLNINIQEDKNRGYFARGTGGMGNEDRYIASLRANVMKDDRHISFDGSMNNTNLRGGGGDGITNNKRLNLNYRNEWGEKLSADGGYSFSNRDNKTIGSSYKQTFYESFTRFDNQDNTSNSEDNNHNLWANLEFKPDSLNYIKLSPTFSSSAGDNLNFGNTTTIQEKISSLRSSISAGDNLSLNGGTNLFYNHKFKKKGRNFSIWSSINYSKGQNERDSENNYSNTDVSGAISRVYQHQLSNSFNDNLRTIVNFSYTEPLGKSSFLELNLNNNRSLNSADKGVRDVDSVGVETFNNNLSNNFEYSFVTNRAGVNYRFINQKLRYTLGLNAQQGELRGEDLNRKLSTNKTTFNLIPSARLVYNFTRQKSLTLNYFGRSNQPGFNQLQPITDNSNLQNIVVGNPELKPEFNHAVNAEFNQTDLKAGYTLFSNISYNQTNDKIVTTRETISDSSSIRQVTSYINTDGFYNLRGNYTFSKPFADRKFTLSLNGGAYFNNNIAFANDQRNVGKNLVLEQGLKFRLDVKDVVDAELNTSYSINTTKYSLASSTDRQTNRLTLGINGRNYFFKDLALGYDVSKNFNTGFINSANANPTILNVFTEYRFLKGNAGTIRIYGFDLLNESTGISRDVFDNEITDRRVNRLSRYFLMSFILRVRKFGS